MGDTLPTAIFYCDESGNTGANWVDPDQPVFVYAGWLVPDEAQGLVAEALEQARADHKIQGTELKWSHIARRRNSATIFRSVFERFLNSPALPFFFAADKNYQVAAKVVETYFDPAYNRNLADGFTGAFAEKKQLVESLLGSESILSEFAAWHRGGTPPPAADVRRMAEELRVHYASIDRLDVASVLADFTAEGITGIRREFAADPWMRTTTAHTLLAFLQRLEGFLREHPLEVEIVHDQLVRFDELFDMMRNLFREGGGADSYEVGDTLLYLKMPTITALRLADSKSEPLVQAADLLAGFVRTVFTKLKRGTPIEPDEQSVMSDLAMLHERWYTWDANLPQELWTAFARTAYGTK